MIGDPKPYVDVMDITFNGVFINIHYVIVQNAMDNNILPSRKSHKPPYDTLSISYEDLYRHYIELYEQSDFFPMAMLTSYIRMNYSFPFYDEITIGIPLAACREIIGILRNQLKLYGLDKPDR